MWKVPKQTDILEPTLFVLFFFPRLTGLAMIIQVYHPRRQGKAFCISVSYVDQSPASFFIQESFYTWWES